MSVENLIVGRGKDRRCADCGNYSNHVTTGLDIHFNAMERRDLNFISLNAINRGNSGCFVCKACWVDALAKLLAGIQGPVTKEKVESVTERSIEI